MTPSSIPLPAPAVRTLLDAGVATLRRAVHLKRVRHNVTAVYWKESHDDGVPGWFAGDIDSGTFDPAECWNETRIRSPFGAPGTVLRVKETWQNNFSSHVSHNGILYRATAATDQSWHGYWAKELPDGTWVDHYDRPFKWRSATTCTPWASRIWIVTDRVTVERGEAGWEWLATLRRVARPAASELQTQGAIR